MCNVLSAEMLKPMQHMCGFLDVETWISTRSVSRQFRRIARSAELTDEMICAFLAISLRSASSRSDGEYEWEYIRKKLVREHSLNINFSQLSHLTEAHFSHFLKKIESVVNAIWKISLTSCSSPSGFELMSACTSSFELQVRDYQLEHVNWLKFYPELLVLSIAHAAQLHDFRGLLSCPSLRELYLYDCQNVKSLLGVINCRVLKRLHLSKCSVRGLTIVYTNLLEHVSIIDCHQLDIEKFLDKKNFFQVRDLTVRNTEHGDPSNSHAKLKWLSTFDFLRNFYHLRSLYWSYSRIADLSGLGYVSYLEELTLKHCDLIQDFGPMRHCVLLRSLTLSDLRKEILPSAFKDFPDSIEELCVESAHFINLDFLVHFPNLKILYINRFVSLQSLAGVRYCTQLREVFLSNLENPVNLRNFNMCTSLKSLSIERCQVEGIGELDRLVELSYLELPATYLEDASRLSIVSQGACILERSQCL